MKKTRTNQLDEMQDQKLLKLEETGFWIMFWALAASIIVQLIAGGKIRQVAGELIVLLIGSVYLCVTTLKNGLWTRTSAPTRKGNALAGIIPAVLIGAVNLFRLIRSNGINAKSLLITASVSLGVYVLCFSVLEIFRAAYNKRRSALDDVPEEEREA